MEDAVEYLVKGEVAVLAVNNPPVNALGVAVRQGLVAGLDRALADDTVKAIVILGRGRTFPAGADISEFNAPPIDPWLPEVCNLIEASSKPVVAALHGTALGGGFEVALSAHYRIAVTGARVGLPEVTLGILPGAGGTQRTPRLAGASAALDLMLSGKPIEASSKTAECYFDRIVEGELEAEALRFAEELIAEGAPVRPTKDAMQGFADPIGYQKAVASRRSAIAEHPELAPAEIINCVEVAELLPFAQGLTFERAAFETLVSSDQSAALRHAFFAERKAAKFPELEAGRRRAVRRIGIVGSGRQGTGVVLACLAAGYEVLIVENSEQIARNRVDQISNMLNRQARNGKISAQDVESGLARLSGHSDFVALADVDMVIEAVPEKREIKQRVYSQLDAVIREDTVLATTSLWTDVRELAEMTEDPQNVVGLRFSRPVRIGRIVEVVAGTQSGADAVMTAVDVVRRMGKVPVRAGGGVAHIGRSILGAYRHAADLLVEQGTTPYLVDEAMRDWGMAKGPYQVMDVEGLNSSLGERQARAMQGGEGERNIRFAGLLLEAGREGRDSGKGFYLYDGPKSAGVPDPEVIEILRHERERLGIRARGFSAEEIQHACLAAMANEGARLLRLGIATRPSDIDVVMMLAYGFPRWHGGPMKSADLAGLLTVKRDIEKNAPMDGVFWRLEPVFDELIKNGQGFDALNA
ncbi:3-hydroxyacyl-CoA dehydrogenase NAD-binding domain-containing protein [Pelagimonas sp. KU-00592-HH]|uniref:3-hydroxyacyl-CoA dehydrogenase NAD-binding domain-containing protein n=1 Tax=Pelagimonas sp. KU-00592-HH TaxID=3127651 RepID=UPI003109C0C9